MGEAFALARGHIDTTSSYYRSCLCSLRTTGQCGQLIHGKSSKNQMLASFGWACAVYAEAVCRALCQLNRRYITGLARLRKMTKQMSLVPDNFANLI
jgi:hypothetical protein